MLSKSHAFKRTSTRRAVKHARLEHERCRSSSRVVERPPRPPPSDKDVGGEGSPLMHQCTQHHGGAASRPSSVFIRQSEHPAKMTYSRMDLGVRRSAAECGGVRRNVAHAACLVEVKSAATARWTPAAGRGGAFHW
jgi:hypothetical protein